MPISREEGFRRHTLLRSMREGHQPGGWRMFMAKRARNELLRAGVVQRPGALSVIQPTQRHPPRRRRHPVHQQHRRRDRRALDERLRRSRTGPPWGCAPLNPHCLTWKSTCSHDICPYMAPSEYACMQVPPHPHLLAAARHQLLYLLVRCRFLTTLRRPVTLENSPVPLPCPGKPDCDACCLLP